MTRPRWQIEFPQAQFHSDALSIQIDMEHPELGVTDREPPVSSSSEMRRMQIISSPPESQLGSPSDYFVRSADLVATYAETSTRPYALQAYWRAVVDDAKPTGWAGLELMVSTQTGLLDAHPRVESRSIIPQGEVLQLDSIDAGTFRSIESRTARFDPASGSGCFLVRPEGSSFSYAEMVAPSDFQQSTLALTNDAINKRSLTHTLIDHWMEKGVIVRARLRGIWVPRTDDTQHAVKYYHAFCASELPLTA